jgi:putative ABC transport system permease protein
MKNTNAHPPKLAAIVLKWVAGKADLEDIQGDMDEVFYQNTEVKGVIKSKMIYWINTLSLFSSYALKKRKNNSAHHPYSGINNIAMFKNYFKISFRNIKKQKAFTLINVLGLAMGMSIALLALTMFMELNKFDEFHPNAENTYRITTTIVEAGDRNKYASSPPALTYTLDEQVTGILNSVHINDYFFPEIEHEGNQISTNAYFTEPSFFELFSFPLEVGNPESLNEPNNAIITKELATKLFGDKPAIDQILQTKKHGQLRVSGVLKEFPKSTHLTFDLLVGFTTTNKFNANLRNAEWLDFKGNYYYFSIDPNKKESVKNQIVEIGKNGNTTFQKEEKSAAYQMQGLVDITPGEMMSDGLGIQFDGPTMLLFFGVALLILIPACFNYTNMSIAVALKRSKEVGIRKVMGSHRAQIINQFLVETILICLFSVIFSSYLFHLIRGEFLTMIAGAASLSLSITSEVVIAFIFFAVATGVLTGIGPAVYFAKITPIQALRSAPDTKVSISGIRKGLLVFQFSLTLILMIGIGVLLKQYQESRSFEFGFKTDNTFVIPTQGQDIQLIINTFSNHPSITNLSFSSSIPGTPLMNPAYIHLTDLQDSLRHKEIFTDVAFSEHMKLEFAWGQMFSRKENQIEQVVVNQELMRSLRLMNVKGDSTTILLANNQRAQIVGVVKDYNHEPLNNRIEPMIIRSNKERFTYAIATMNQEASSGNYSLLESSWNTLFPSVIFEASLLKNEIDIAYTFFKIGLKIFGFLASLAISISCLGLLGMVIYATENRIKEVAIRKILGANKKNLFQTLAGLFIKLWGIALIIAIPISYLFYDKVMIQLYNKFSDGVGFIEIALSVIVTLSLGALAIFWQVNKIARINPAENLRTD